MRFLMILFASSLLRGEVKPLDTGSFNLPRCYFSLSAAAKKKATPLHRGETFFMTGNIKGEKGFFLVHTDATYFYKIPKEKSPYVLQIPDENKIYVDVEFSKGNDRVSFCEEGSEDPWIRAHLQRRESVTNIEARKLTNTDPIVTALVLSDLEERIQDISLRVQESLELVRKFETKVTRSLASQRKISDSEDYAAAKLHLVRSQWPDGIGISLAGCRHLWVKVPAVVEETIAEVKKIQERYDAR